MTTAERRPNPPEDTSSERFQPGAERTISVNLDGRTLQIASSTMEPQMMREMRESFEKRSRK